MGLQKKRLWFWTAEEEAVILDCRRRGCNFGLQKKRLWFWTAEEEAVILDCRRRGCNFGLQKKRLWFWTAEEEAVILGGPTPNSEIIMYFSKQIQILHFTKEDIDSAVLQIFPLCVVVVVLLFRVHGKYL